MNHMWKYLITFSILFTLCANHSIEASTISFRYITNGYWAETSIQWGVKEDIIKGYDDSTFQPNKKVSEAEFLAMLIRAYGNEFQVGTSVSGSWSEPYYTLAKQNGWKLADNKDTFTRGNVANIIYSILNKQWISTNSSISYMLDRNLSSGLTSSTVEGYGSTTELNRAQAITFIYRLKGLIPSIEAELPSDYSLRGITVGDTLATLTTTLGEPNRIDTGATQMKWYIYNSDYALYAQYAIANNKVVAIYSNAPASWYLNNNLQIGKTTKEALMKKYDIEYDFINSVTVKDGNINMQYYFDKHNDNKLEGVLISLNDEYSLQEATTSQQWKEFEKQIFDYTNVFRLKHGASVLNWSDQLASVARKHSRDMFKNNYFDHVDLNGKRSYDRIESAGIEYSFTGENIATGQFDSIEAVNDWVNSSGHRANLLENFTHLGVGVHGNYYTQNFIHQ